MGVKPMLVAVTTNFVADKKQSLVGLLDRLHAAVSLAVGGEPATQFLFLDPARRKVSGVKRAIARIPACQVFETAVKETPSLSNRLGTPAADRQIDYAILREVVAGVPKSFPFEGLVISFRVPGLGPSMGPPVGGPAITLSYGGSGGLGGSYLDLQALRVVEADLADKQLAPLPPSMAALLAACGKQKSTLLRAFDIAPAGSKNGPLVARFAEPSAQVATAIRLLVDEYRANLDVVVARAKLPHELPRPVAEAGAVASTGPRKTELTRAFAPMGYDCAAGAGTFTLRRRTGGNLIVEVRLDVGSWSRALTGVFAVHGMGFTERLPLPVSAAPWGASQYPIEGRERWGQLVDNLAAVVAEYDRSFVPALEAISGPTPAWYVAGI